MLAWTLTGASPGDVIHLTITPGWEHQLDIGPIRTTFGYDSYYLGVGANGSLSDIAASLEPTSAG